MKVPYASNIQFSNIFLFLFFFCLANHKLQIFNITNIVFQRFFFFY